MSKLINQIIPHVEGNTRISGLALDSRQVRGGDLFVAVKGTQQDGRDYISQALKSGAVAIVYEREGYQLPDHYLADYPNVTFVAVDQLAHQLSTIAGHFYDDPAQHMALIGVTGTNGKTTVSQLIAQALDLLGMPCGIMGTLGTGFWQKLQTAKQTTPDAISVQANLAWLKESGAQAVSMEVSSHGLDQGRVEALPFKVAVFTNLSRDHLDYHASLEDYAAAKARLFSWPTLQSSVINYDDPVGRTFINLSSGLELFSYSLQDAEADIYCVDSEFSDQGITATICAKGEQGILHSPLIGQFNLSNVLAVVGALLAQGYTLQAILEVIPKLQGPEGRMQRVGGGDKPLVVVDYAHTPDALEKVLTAIRPQVKGQLICVFGCGGNRDKGKRPLMASISERVADKVVVTDDNPRHEQSASIIHDILQGFEKPQDVLVIADREQAILTAVRQAGVGDIVLIAGKGHEDYQDVAGVRSPFSDMKIAQQALSQ